MLKQQLRQALEEVEARERALDQGLELRTLAEVEELERKLSDALADVRARKDELRQKDSGSPEDQ